MAVPYTFSTATGSLPLSQLDSNFSTAITIGNTAVVLGDTITTINNLTLGNVAITSVSTAFPNGYLANSNVIVGTTTLTLGSTVTSISGLSLSNVTISSGNVTISNVTATTANVTTANVGTLVVIGDATVGGNTTVTGNITAAKGTFTSANVSGTANVSTLAVVINATVGGNATVTGNVGIGVTPSAGQSFVVGKDITGAVQSVGATVNGTIQSGVTSVAWGFRTNLSTVASAFTLANLRHHDATQGTFGAGSTVTNQVGFFVDNSLIGATNNYGFFGNIASGTNRWNLYMVGTADNYMLGNLGIGTNTPAGNLQIFGTGDRSLMVTGGTSGTVSVQLGDSAAAGQGGMSYDNSVDALFLKSAGAERMRIDSAGNAYIETGLLWQYAPTPTTKAAAATLTAAELATDIITLTGTTYTITLPTGTALDTYYTGVPAVNIGYDFHIVNTASGIITIAVGAAGMTSVGLLTVAATVSAHFRLRRTAANTYILYRLS